MFCGRSLDSVLGISSDLHPSKVYVSSGLFRWSHKLSEFPCGRYKIAPKLTMTNFEGKPIEEDLPLK